MAIAKLARGFAYGMAIVGLAALLVYAAFRTGPGLALARRIPTAVWTGLGSALGVADAEAQADLELLVIGTICTLFAGALVVGAARAARRWRRGGRS